MTRPLALMLLFVVPVLAQQPDKFRSDAGKYAVQFPVKPTERKQTAKGPTAEITIHIAEAEGMTGGLLVIWNEIAAKPLDPQKVLTGVAKAQEDKGKVVSDKATAFGPDKHPARELVVDTKEGPRVRSLLIVANGRLYQVVASGANEFVGGKVADDFTKSFELLK